MFTFHAPHSEHSSNPLYFTTKFPKFAIIPIALHPKSFRAPMNRSTIILLLISFGIIAHTDYAQDSPSDYSYTPTGYTIVPPSPNVSQFLDFKEFEVDNFHGTPLISFPLYTLRVGNIEVPITLSYHSGGIRVNQKCGNAGMGWTLSCGAEIGHTVYGAPDDANRNIHGLFNLNATEKSFRTKLISKEADYDPTDGETFMSKHSWQAVEGDRYYLGLTDLANDLYTLHGLGLSATFAYDENRNIVVSSENPIKIEYSSKNPSFNDFGCDGHGYTVQDQQGLTYTFLTQERTKYNYRYGSPMLTQRDDSIYYSSAWHLDEIRDLCGNKIQYNYFPQPGRAYNDFASNVFRKYSSFELSNRYLNRSPSLTSVVYYPQVLKQIHGAGISIAFEYIHMSNTNRQIPLIKKMTISTPDGTGREIVFRYDNTGMTLLREIYDQGERILTFEYDGDDTWDFEFYDDSQDFGGYNNDIDNYGNLIPTVSTIGLGANRSVVPDKSRKGSLTKITYPTGGYVEFDWESNDFKYLSDIVYKGPSLSDAPVIKTHIDTLRMSMDESYRKLKIADYAVTGTQDVVIDLTRYFNMNPANLFGTDYHALHEYDISLYPLQQPPTYPHVRFIRKDGTQAGKVTAVYYIDRSTVEEKGKNEPINVPLASGIYDIELINPMMVANVGDFLERNMQDAASPAGRIYIKRITYDNINHQAFRNLWCGQRIRRITSCTGDPNDTPLRKDFYYSNDLAPGATSGTIQFLPTYTYMYYVMYAIQVGALGYAGSEVNCVTPTAFPNTTSGNMSVIEYPHVRTQLSKADRYEPSGYLSTMSEEFFYSSSRNHYYADFNKSRFLNFQPPGARMYTSRAFYRGNLLSHKVGDGGLRYTRKAYEYNIHEKDDLPILTTDAFTLCDFTNAIGINKYGTYDYGIGTYNIIPYTKTIAREITEETDGMTTSKEYSYFYDRYTDKLDYNLIKTISSSSSEGERVTTHYTYPYGKSHYLPTPETEFTVCDNDVINAKRTEYDPTTRLPLRVFEISKPLSANNLVTNNQETTPALREAINTLTYEYRYNAQGNLIGILYKGKALASYIWGYNGLYPVIEAKNVTYDALYSAALTCGLTNDQITGNKTATQTLISSVSEKLRDIFPDGEITSLAYHWLFGITENIDSRGISVSYDYDNRGRLCSTRDINRHLIQKCIYNYADKTTLP